VAGKLQGLMAGDLGDVGDATPSLKTISFLLDNLMEHLCNNYKLDDVPTSAAAAINAASNPISYNYQPHALSDGRKLALELTVRLLVVEQRLYLARAEWDEWKDPTERIIDQMTRQTQQQDDYYSYNPILREQNSNTAANQCSILALARSPFVTRILRPLRLYTEAESPATHDNTHSSQSQSQQQTIRDVTSNTANNSNNIIDVGGGAALRLQAAVDLAIEKEPLVASSETRNIKQDIVTLVHIVSAASEIFPFGAAWSTNTQCWYDLDSFDALHGSSLGDLTVLVNVIGNILKFNGKFDSSTELQKWALICLARLALATDACSATSKKHSDPQEETSLAVAWKKIWSVIFCPDFCYRNLTKTTIPSSNGDLVLRLLTQIVRFQCTEAAGGTDTGMALTKNRFLDQRQVDIWNLPVYERFRMKSISAFCLLFVTLSTVEFTDQFKDTIGSTVSGDSSWITRIQQFGGGRRSRLLCFCLHFLDHSLDAWENPHLASVVSACLTALTGGSVPSPSSVFHMVSGQPSISVLLRGDVQFTRVLGTVINALQHHHISEKKDIFSALWKPPRNYPPDFFLARTNEDGVDYVRSSLLYIHLASASRDRLLSEYAFASSSTASIRFFALTQAYLGSWIKSTLSSGSNDEDSEDGYYEKKDIYQLPFLTRMTMIKVYLTVVLSGLTRSGSSETKEVWTSLSVLLFSFINETFLIGDDSTTFAIVLADLIRITQGIIEAKARMGLSFPEELKQALKSLYDFSENILHDYLNKDFESFRQSSTMQRKMAHAADDLMDDESDEESVLHMKGKKGFDEGNGSTGKKRKRQIREQTVGRGSLSGIPAVHLSRQCCHLFGSLILSLHPSAKNCNLVAKALLCSEDPGQPSLSEYDIDVFGGFHLIDILCTESILLHRRPLYGNEIDPGDDTNNDDSVVSLICRIIQTVRQSSPTHSVGHLFGYSVCARMVEIVDGTQWCTPLDQTEASLVVTLLHIPETNSERRTLSLRPNLRAQQLKAGTVALKIGGEQLRRELDRVFGSAFVLPSLVNAKGMLRRVANAAVAASLVTYEEEKVIEGVRQTLAPVLTDSNSQRIHFRRWYQKLGGNDSDAENHVWEDSFPSVQFCVLDCWVAMASSSFDLELTHQIFFDLVSLSKDAPSFESLCFRILEKLAFLKGYPSFARFSDSESSNFASRWLESGESLHDIPLFIAAPNTFRSIIRSGHWNLHVGEYGSKNAFPFDVGRLQYEAVLDYLARNIHNFLPKIVTQVIKESPKIDLRRRLMDDRYMKDLCKAFDGHFDDDVVKKVLTSELPSLLAHVSLVQNDPESSASISSELMTLLNGLLSEDKVRRKGMKHTGLTIRRLLDKNYGLQCEETLLLLMNSIKNLVEIYGRSSSKNLPVDYFGNIGSSSIEFLLYSRYRLGSCFVKSQMKSRWLVLEAVFRLMIEHMHRSGYNNLQLGFSSQILSSVLMDVELSPIRPLVLRSLKDVIEKIAARSKAQVKNLEYLSVFARELLGVVFEIHRKAQEDLINECTRQQKHMGTLLHRSSELFREDSNSDVWGWKSNTSKILSSDLSSALQCHSRYAENSLVESLKETFDILRLIVVNRQILGLPSDIFCFVTSESNESMHEILAVANPYFSAQYMIKNFFAVSDSENSHTEHSVDRLPLLSASTLNEIRLRFELPMLEDYLRQHRHVHFDTTINEACKLVKNVKNACSASMPSDVRVLASRCLGELPTSLVQVGFSSISTQTSKSVFYSDAFEHGNLLQCLQAKSIECLVDAVRNPCPELSLIAMDTLKALLSETNGKESVKFINDPTVQAFLDPLVENDTGKASLSTKLYLTEDEVDKLRFGDPNIKDKQDFVWCWHERFWKPQGIGINSFSLWICRVVSALLVCCYGKNGNEKQSRAKATYHFFSQCQRMSCIHAEFAQSIFPAIVLDLLLTEGDDYQGCGDQVLLDTWIGSPENTNNKRLSHGFNVIFETCDGNDNGAVDLALDVLDMLRQFTLCRFVSSPNHQRNSPSPSKSKSDNSRQGVPYGTVLSLDGRVLAEACIAVHRFESALMYIEAFADARFRGSTSAMEQLSLGKELRIRQLNVNSGPIISGFSYSRGASRQEDIHQDCVAFLSVLRRSFTALGDRDTQRACFRRESDFAFMHGGQKLSTNNLQLENEPPSMMQLQILDNVSNGHALSARVKMSLAECLDGLEVRNTLKHFIAGLSCLEDFVFTNDEKMSLKEKWYECRLCELQWDDDLLSFIDSPDYRDANSSANFTDITEIQSSAANISFLHSGEVGYNECIVRALEAVRCEDYDSCHGAVRAARMQVLANLPKITSTNSSLLNIQDIIERLQLTNDLEDFSAALDYGILENRWNLTMDENVRRPISEFSGRIQGIVLRFLLSGSLFDHAKVAGNLCGHILRECRSFVDKGQYQAAHGSLQRLQSLLSLPSLLTLQDFNKDALSPFRLRLREAAIFEAKGDFVTAINSAKLIAKHLDAIPLKQLIVEQKSILADAYVYCGDWTARHKVEPTDIIVSKYVKPAVKNLEEIYSLQKTQRNCDRLISALLTQSRLVSEQFEKISSRVNSLEWHKAGNSLSDRLRELERGKPQYEKAIQFLQSKNEKQRRTKDETYDKNIGIVKFWNRQQRLIEVDYTERSAILESMESYRVLAVQSIVMALAIAGTGQVDDVSQHVYRLVSLWLSCQKENPLSENVDTNIAEAVEIIPSFRFVPLVTQLFSQLQNSLSLPENVVNHLMALLLRMILDHPYHSIPHLVQLSRSEHGKRGNAPADMLINKVKQKDPKFAGELTESYRVVAEAYDHLALSMCQQFNAGVDITFDNICKKGDLRLDKCMGSGSRKMKLRPCIFTKPPSIQPRKDYGNGTDEPQGTEFIESFESVFRISPSGVCRPKILVCLGSRGGKFKQLVKADEDIRQDAVMEQVFGHVNELMSRKHQEKAVSSGTSMGSDFRVKTYNILPLSPRTGVS
jgi:hypothetical protein